MALKKKKTKNIVFANKKIEVASSAEVIKMIGAEIKRRRIQMSRNLNDYDVGCSISYLSKMERGQIVPRYSSLEDATTKRLLEIKLIESANIEVSFIKKGFTPKSICRIIPISNDTNNRCLLA